MNFFVSTYPNIAIFVLSVIGIPLIPVVCVCYLLGVLLYALWFILNVIWAPEGAFEDSSYEEFPFTLIKHFAFTNITGCFPEVEYHNFCPNVIIWLIGAIFAFVYAIIGCCIALAVLTFGFALGLIVIPFASLFLWPMFIGYILRVFFAIFTMFRFSFK